MFSGDVNSFMCDSKEVYGGIEYSAYLASMILSLRAGLNLDHVSGGIGIIYDSLGVDYSVSFQSIGLIHKISVTLKTSEKPQEKANTPANAVNEPAQPQPAENQPTGEENR